MGCDVPSDDEYGGPTLGEASTADRQSWEWLVGTIATTPDLTTL